MPKPFLVLVFFLITSAATYAQNDRERKQRDSSIIIFSETPRDGKSAKKHHAGDNNVIKIAPLGFLKGSIPIYYERRIADFFTIQAGVGVTTRNYIRGVMHNALDGDGESKDKLEYTWSGGYTGDNYGADDDLFDYTYRTTKTGYMFSLQPRIYFDSDAPDGGFLAVSYDSYKYNFESQKLKGDGSSDRGKNTVQEYEKLNDIMVLFGYQALHDRITLEYTTGIGVRNIKGEKYATTTDNNGNYIDGMASYKRNTLNFELSIKVGFHF
jgi:hypothetical protein